MPIPPAGSPPYKLTAAKLTAAGAAVAVPQQPTAGFTVAANTQVMFFVDIDMTLAGGDLVVSGLLKGLAI